MSARRHAATALLLLALLLTVGCDGGGAEPTPPSGPASGTTTATTTATPSTTPGTTPSASPTPTAAADPHPDLADLVVTTSGLGPLTVGVPPTANAGAEMIAFDADYCVSADLGTPADPGRWVPDGYANDLTYLGEPGQPFYVDADDTGVHRIDVMATSPHTPEGITVTSTLEDLQGAYPQLQGPFAGPVSRVWWISDRSGSLVFETQDDADGLLPAGTPEMVVLIRVLAPGVAPEFAAANSGNVAGGCGY